MSRFRIFWPLLFLALLAQPAGGQVQITEFMANNNATLADEDGAYSDWIEIYNGTTNWVNLLNWCLTDNASKPAKWRFPATNVGPAQFLVVFASGKDRTTPGKPLHTNFKLAAEGGYLGLFYPDGVTAATQFLPSYLPQLPDISYGFGFQLSDTTLIASNAVGRLLVPANSAVDSAWMRPDFDDSGWRRATNGIGYETGVSAASPAELNILAGNPLGYWRLDEVQGSTAINMGTLGAVANGSYTGSVGLGQVGLQPPAFAGFEPNNLAPRFGPGDSYVTTGQPLLNNRYSFTLSGWFKEAGAPGSRTGLWGQNDAIEFGFYDASTLGLWTPYGGAVSAAVSLATNTWHHAAATGDGTALSLYLDGVLLAQAGANTLDYGSSPYSFNIGGGGVWDPSGNQFNGWIDEVAVYDRALSASEVALLYSTALTNSVPRTSTNYYYTNFIRTDLKTAMLGVNSSCYLRVPFVVNNPADVARLVLRLRYNDGVAAWLNGWPVTSANAPASPVWNSTALAPRAPTLSAQAAEFDLSKTTGWLVPGTNILALQGLNAGATNGDFLLNVELTCSMQSLGLSGARYFTTPTPGAVNGIGSADMGPIISQVGSVPALPAQPAPADRILVTAKVLPAFSAVAGVTLNWRVMFGTLIQTPMFDDGLHGDGAAGDGVYGASIPANVAGRDQMVRWYITATDATNRVSRWPLFVSATDSEEYLGTVIADPTIQSALPVVHTYIANQSAADTASGARCSIFYLGEFYDNVLISLHGQSSGGWPKKSYNLDFNHDHRFRYRPGGQRQKDAKLMSNWGDKSRTHNALAHEYCARVGSAAHWDFQVRVQRNGQFWSIADLMEDADDHWLDRLGRDPNGALYKIYDNLSSTYSAEKKTRQFEDKSDLQGLINNLDESLPLATRALYACDHIDLPQAVSYFTGLAVTSDQDHGHKNFYVYCDSLQSGEWAIFPWDLDLSWGRNWVDSIGYMSDILYVTNCLNFYPGASIQGKPANRLYDLMFAHPDFRRMYLRHLRTALDQVLQPPGTPSGSGLVETRIRQMMDAMDPPGRTNTDAYLDYVKWGYWGANTQMRSEAQRIINFYLPGRRAWLAGASATLNGETLPPSQPSNVVVQVLGFDFNPVSHNQDEEYVCLTNANSIAVDLSGWRLGGGVDFAFKPGTVMPANSALYVSPKPAAFRARALAPHGNMGLYVTGPYSGHLSARGESVALADDTGRVVSTNGYPGTPSLAQQFLRITEIMYHPALLAGDTNAAGEFEYLELKNISPTTALDLRGVTFTNGIQFKFTNATPLAPGQFIVLVKNPAAFRARYGNGLPLAGPYAGYLNNGGERITLWDSVNEEVLDFTYDKAWYPITDGLGFSLVTVNENAEPDAWNSKANWRASGTLGGSPGAVDPPPRELPPVLVSEALTHSDPGSDWIELFNPATTNVDVGGWFLTDDFFTPKKYRLPPGTVIPPAGYAVLIGTNSFNLGAGGFGLSRHGEQVFLFSGDAATNLTGYYHGFDYSAAPNGVTFGRYVTSQGMEQFVLLQAATPETNNAGPRIGPVVISEIMYHPPDLPGGSNDVTNEYIELHNITATNVPLWCVFTNEPGYGTAAATNTWRLRQAVSYDFPANTALEAASRLLVVPFNPATNAAQLAAFVALYHVPSNATILGPWSGRLNNAGDTIELQSPDRPEVTTSNLFVPYVTIDQVAYQPVAPWPNQADGLGSSLQRCLLGAYGNDPTNWAAALPTPGWLNAPSPRPVLSLAPAPGSAFAVAVLGDAGLRYTLESKSDLQAAPWTPILTLVPVSVAPLIMTDTNVPGTARFYRVRVQ